MSSFNFNYYPEAITATPLMIIVFGIALACLIAGLFLLVKRKKVIGAIVFILGIVFSGAIFYQRNPQDFQAPVFAPRTMLAALWENYKKDYYDAGSGRTFDTQRANDTTSEGQGYAMLRAVWIDDEATFDKSWAWTQANLQRPDNLFSWLWGRRTDGTMGVITAESGQNSASDADTDIATALIFAYSRWQKSPYLEAAVPIIKGIWDHEVFMAAGKPYLTISNASAVPPGELLNPSYFAPYAYRIFGTLVPSENWQGLIDSSYQVLLTSEELVLDKKTSAYLPPDWIEVNAITGALSASPFSGQTTNFGYDAIRVPWRIALDWEWNHEPRAQAALARMGFLDHLWTLQGKLTAVYGHDGTAIAPIYESPAMYGGTLGYFLVIDPAAAHDVYMKKLASLYDPDKETWKLPLNYYDSNMVWFGMALYHNALPNLFVLNTSSSP